MPDYKTLPLRKETELHCDGFVPLAGPYSSSVREQGMLRRLLADAESAGKETAFSGYLGRVEVWQRKKTY
jgi:hypothetical protein